MSTRKVVLAALVVVVAACAVAVVVLYKPGGQAGDKQQAELTLAAAETDAIDESHVQEAQRLINGGLKYLLAKRDADGGWGEGVFRPAITALVIKALVRHPDFNSSHPIIADGMKVLMKYRHEDGGFYEHGLQNYTTSIAVMTLVAVDRQKYKAVIGDAVKFLKGIQIKPGSKTPDGRAISEDDPMRGGTSYGKHGRPDLSNLGMTVEAWHEAGLTGDDPAMKEALIFLERTQNRKESNPLAWAQAGENDGGFAYAAALKDDPAMGESKAGAAGPEGKGLRSYGSMTYVGFKSLLYAGLSKDDPRVRAAFDWIRRYWRLDSNPNMPHKQSLEGLYYYYHAMAKALRAWGQPIITDAKGIEHNWRQELIDALADRVQPDGSWINSASRWEEADPMLVTTYAVLALEEALMR